MPTMSTQRPLQRPKPPSIQTRNLHRPSRSQVSSPPSTMVDVSCSSPLYHLLYPNCENLRRASASSNGKHALWISEELASKAKELLNLLIKSSVPSGNLYSGGLGSYYLLLEYCDYLASASLQASTADKQISTTSNTSICRSFHAHHHASSSTTCRPSSPYSPYRCKRLIQQALDATVQAMERFTPLRHKAAVTASKKNLHNKLTSSSVSILESDWIGAHALMVVCLYRLESIQTQLNQQEAVVRGGRLKTRMGLTNSTPTKQSSSTGNSDTNSNNSQNSTSSVCHSPNDSKHTVSDATPTKKYHKKSKLSPRGPFMNAIHSQTPPPPSPNPPPLQYQVVLEKIIDRLKLIQHPDFCRNVFWNHDVLGGRAGALQLIWWLRKELQQPLMAQELVVSIACYMIEQGLQGSKALIPVLTQPACHDHRTQTLFWLCDSHGTHIPYLNAPRGVVGIFYTLLGLQPQDWTLVEQQIPNSRNYIRNSIDAYFVIHRGTKIGNKENKNKSVTCGDHGTPHPCNENQRGPENNLGGNRKDKRKIYPNEEPRTIEMSRPQGCTTLQPFGFSVLQQRIFFAESGNLRPFLDASPDHDTSVDWLQGSAGLVMLLLQACEIFQSKDYLAEAHRICDAVIFPRAVTTKLSGLESNGTIRSQIGNNSSRFHRSFVQLSLLDNNNDKCRQNGRISLHSRFNSKGPAGMASIAFCFLLLSDHCENGSLQQLWKNRAIHCAQHAYQDWMRHLDTVPISSGGWNPFSVHEGLGCLVSFLWQMSIQNEDSDNTASRSTHVQMPFYFRTHCMQETHEEPLTLSIDDVEMLAPLCTHPRPLSPPSIERKLDHLNDSARSMTPTSPHMEAFFGQPLADEAAERKRLAERKLMESRKRRAKAEKEARRRKALEAAAHQKKMQQEQLRQAQESEKRKKQLEERKKLQLVSRKVAELKLQEETKVKEEAVLERKIEDINKMKALALARQQAQARVQERQKQKDEDQVKREDSEKRSKDGQLAMQKKLESEQLRRQAKLEKQLKTNEADAEMAKQKRKNPQTASQKKAEIELTKQISRKQELEEKIARQKEFQQKLEEGQIRAAAEQAERREENLKAKALAEKKRIWEKSNKEKALEEKKFRRELEKALKKEESRQRMKCKREAAQERMQRVGMKKELAEQTRLHKRAELFHKKEMEQIETLSPLQSESRKKKLSVNPSNSISHEVTVDPGWTTLLDPEKQEKSISTVSEKKESACPSHFSRPTRLSMFWTLQSDSRIGTSDEYSIALVDHGQTSAMTRNLAVQDSPKEFPVAVEPTKSEVVSCSSKFSIKEDDDPRAYKDSAGDEPSEDPNHSAVIAEVLKDTTMDAIIQVKTSSAHQSKRAVKDTSMDSIQPFNPTSESRSKTQPSNSSLTIIQASLARRRHCVKTDHRVQELSKHSPKTGELKKQL